MVASATSWNLAGDFSASANPNGAWQYGTTLGAATDFQAFSGHTTSPNGVAQWWDGFYADAVPSVSFNPGAQPADAGSWSLAPRTLALQPGPGGEWAVVRWTAPADGEYRLDATFMALGAPSTRIVSVTLSSGGALTYGTLSTPGQAVAADGVLSLRFGQALDFSVGPGSIGADLDGTSLAVQIAAVPEAPTAMLAALGLAVVGGFRSARCRRARSVGSTEPEAVRVDG